MIIIDIAKQDILEAVLNMGGKEKRKKKKGVELRLN